jgi:uncharacterized repeat protein (TIGR03803 family)
MKPLAISLVLVFGSLAAHAGETVLYSFKGSPDGYAPVGGLISDQKGNLFGVTSQGGAHALGTVFELSPNGAGGWNETVLYSFTGGADGQYPGAGLIWDGQGNLYGTTVGGGYGCAPKCGSVFELSLGTSGWTINALHTFRNPKDGETVLGGVVMGATGSLYGTTARLGPKGAGTVFRLDNSGDAWTLTTLFGFEIGVDGEDPEGLLVLGSDGAIYGTTAYGGTLIGNQAYGVFYKLSQNTKGKWIEKVLYSFKGAGDGGNPPFGLVADEQGNLYGVSPDLPSQRGCAFQFSPQSTNKWKKKNVYAFPFPKYGDPDIPNGLVSFDQSGNAYGVTYGGGSAGVGTVYSLAEQQGTPWPETTLYMFARGSDGERPEGQLLRDGKGNLFGVTQEGGGTGCGGNGCGSVFEITP